MMANYRSDAVTQINAALTMDDVARRYGYQVSRAGYMRCPFHREKTASLKLYPGNRGWYCFGCGAGGDTIAFVRRLFGLDFPSALLRISFDFGLDIANGERPSPAQTARIAAERRSRELAEREWEAEVNALCGEHRRLWAAFKSAPPRLLPDGEIEWPEEWIEAAKKLDAIQYQIDHLEEINDRNRKNANGSNDTRTKAG